MPGRRTSSTLSVGDAKIIDDVMLYMKRFYSECTIKNHKCWLRLVVEHIGISRIKTRTADDIYEQIIRDTDIINSKGNFAHVKLAVDNLQKFMKTPEFIDYRTYEEKFFEDV